MWQKAVKKTLFTLAIDNWQPEICDITFPLLKRYADKMGADFYVIKDRKFPEFPITYEKLQIYQLAQEMENDFSVYFDADALVHPETPDITDLLPKDTVAHNGVDKNIRYKTDRFFWRDGRGISSCNWCTIASDYCIELWKPPEDLTPQECIDRCYPSVDEANSGVITPYHLIDDFILSRNIAKYGLKFKTLINIFKEMGLENAWFFWHKYIIPPDQKIVEMKKVLEQWRLV